MIPKLLIDTNHAVAHRRNAGCPSGFRLLSLVLELAQAVAIKYGDSNLALTGSHRAVVAAERSQDPVVIASAARHLADAMIMHGQAHAAVSFALTAAQRLESALRTRRADGVSVLGMLYLKAAMAQAAIGASDDRAAAAAARTVACLLKQADKHAKELGTDGLNAMWTAFGTTNVRLHQVAAHVHLSQAAEAIAVANAIPDTALKALPKERRAHFLADLAHGFTQVGNHTMAVNALLDAENQAKEEVRRRPRTRQLVEKLRLLGTGSADRRLQALAMRCGLPG
ncbi:hypothetical protein [Streptomyces flavofungini]|uniref:hypothetical protein n=1 Tax=Streptomyces flavofungini TaxID=68200 RepID=UPI00198551CB|nr:hypothetical protein [Streptomyces flavofungini]GHC88034.1 hypothetical protein GCM10010349_75000 [Streptomyces flavofungini]